jgi:hypothetical protein
VVVRDCGDKGLDSSKRLECLCHVVELLPVMRLHFSQFLDVLFQARCDSTKLSLIRAQPLMRCR